MSTERRRPIVAANWKMNGTPSHARALTSELVTLLDALDLAGVDVVICPAAVSLGAVREVIGGRYALGAQNMHWQESGAFTGEISPAMVAELCGYVILGHSERRQYFGETDDGVHRKVLAALDHGLVPIVCCGESLDQREAGETHDWIGLQLRGALHGLQAEALVQAVIAYEPIWAIGTGRASSGRDANAVAAHIRSIVADIGGEDAGRRVRIQYGGSVTGGNAAEFLGQPEIDGALVGGASLKPNDFAAIVRVAAGLPA